MLDAVLPDDRLVDAADVLETHHRGNLEQNLHAHFVVGMNVRSHVDVDADIDVIELRIDQRVDADSADARLKRTGGHGHALTDLERRLLAVDGADLRLLDDLGAAVVQQELHARGRNADREIARVKIRQVVESQAVVGRCGGAGAVVPVVELVVLVSVDWCSAR